MIRISSGIVAETLLFLNTVSQIGCSYVKETNSINVSYGLNNDLSTEFAKQSYWIDIKDGRIVLTTKGSCYLEEFKENGLSKALWRNVLRDYIKAIEPAWSKRIPYGRQEAYLFMSSDERRCVNSADLMNNTDDDTVEWWDQINNWMRTDNSMPLLDVGRKGEKLTIEYENDRVNQKPIWKAIETNFAGYDIQSIQGSNIAEKLLIEVKASNNNYDNAKMTISRNEWEVAKNTPNGGYLFYVWLLGLPNRLAILTPDDIRPHIPLEFGSGKWKEVEIAYKTFEVNKWKQL